MNYKGIEIPDKLIAVARVVLAKLESFESTPELLQELRVFLKKQLREEIDLIDKAQEE
jgi:hypothetical protein